MFVIYASLDRWEIEAPHHAWSDVDDLGPFEEAALGSRFGVGFLREFFIRII